ncbi:hypothetical protein THAOC_21158 [Thalassiosira oceanica]|uniref:B30.2/SPRY domain-containing protein n=1 Tax=Thalassiosira oceanica TaxID=159749 RepID=K0S1S4_THAOC|nr:hypothetical protein THAOC_21158 [Thalassiosira oceanica]|eukprot:EJK58694.1 hypothetical protein THAOC_21158 [Thalassiosira oceanica]
MSWSRVFTTQNFTLQYSLSRWTLVLFGRWPMPNLDPERYANEPFSFFMSYLREDFLAVRTDDWGSGNVHTCDCNFYSGTTSWTNWAGEERCEINWEGMEGYEAGDTIGMQLNLDEGTLTVYKNNRRLGVMKGGLSGSYCWCATMAKATITIERCDPPTA